MPPASTNERSGSSCVVHLVAPLLEPEHLRGLDAQAGALALRDAIQAELLGHGQVGAEVEEIVLDAPEPLVEAVGQLERARDADQGAELVDRPVGLDPQSLFGTRATVPEARLTQVAAARVDPIEVDHAADYSDPDGPRETAAKHGGTLVTTTYDGCMALAQTILVVDDEPTISQVVASYLRREGFRAVTARRRPGGASRRRSSTGRTSSCST